MSKLKHFCMLNNQVLVIYCHRNLDMTKSVGKYANCTFNPVLKIGMTLPMTLWCFRKVIQCSESCQDLIKIANA